MLKNHYRLMTKSLAIGILLSIGVTQPIYAKIDTTAELTLADVLKATLANNTITQNTTTSSANNTSWLASNPKLALSYLQSSLTTGTDEAEISLSLPIKSSQQRKIDKQLIQAKQVTQSLLVTNQKLQYSGLIREQVWAVKIAEKQLETLQQKLVFLQKLEQQYQTLFNNSAATKYPLLLIQQEKITTKIAQLEQQQQLNSLHNQYHALTGLTKLPKRISEVKLADNFQLNALLTTHPLIKNLEQQWFEHQQRLLLADNNSEAWSLSLTAKSLNNTIVDEQQLGIAAEMPLNFFNIKNQVVSNEWAQAQGDYLLTRSLLLINLKNELQTLLSQQVFLEKKQQLLTQAKAISKDIISETQLLVAADQIEQGQAIRRMLNAFNTKAEFSLNQLLLLKNNAMLRQAAGLSL